MRRSGDPFARRRGRLPRWAVYVIVGLMSCAPVYFLALGVTGVSSVLHTQDLLRPVPGGLETIGTIVGSRECGGDCNTYQPVIRFSDQRGRLHTFTAPYQDNFPATGSHVRVSYDPRATVVAHDISVSPSTWDLELGTAIFAIVVGGLGIAVLLTVDAMLLARSLRRRKA
jgi:hypothetical protein